MLRRHTDRLNFAASGLRHFASVALSLPRVPLAAGTVVIETLPGGMHLSLPAIALLTSSPEPIVAEEGAVPKHRWHGVILNDPAAHSSARHAVAMLWEKKKFKDRATERKQRRHEPEPVAEDVCDHLDTLPMFFGGDDMTSQPTVVHFAGDNVSSVLPLRTWCVDRAGKPGEATGVLANVPTVWDLTESNCRIVVNSFTLEPGWLEARVAAGEARVVEAANLRRLLEKDAGLLSPTGPTGRPRRRKK